MTALHGGKVWAVDVNSNTARPEALLLRNGEPLVVSTGVGRQLDEAPRRGPTRPFRLFDTGDLVILRSMVMAHYALSRIPHLIEQRRACP